MEKTRTSRPRNYDGRRERSNLEIDFERIRQENSLYNLVCNHLGQPQHENSSYAQWLCPFHDDRRSPSLTIYHDTRDGWFVCFGCGAQGDVVDWIARRQSLTLSDSVKTLVRGKVNQYIMTCPTSPKELRPKSGNDNWIIEPPFFEEKFTPEDLWMAKHYLSHDRKMWPFAQRAGWGFIREYRRIRPYLTLENETLFFPCPMVAIPHYADFLGGQSLFGVKYRRDDYWALYDVATWWTKQDAKFMKVINDLIARNGSEPTDEDVMEAIFQRWASKPGSVPFIFNATRIEEKIVPYVVLVEGETCVASLESAGYPAIGVKPTTKWLQITKGKPAIAQKLKHVDLIAIVQDQDDAGRKSAAKLQNAMKSLGEHVVVIEPPTGYHDAGDVCTKGDVHAWLSRHKLEPYTESV